MAGRGYEHYFSKLNLPSGISEEECVELYPRLLLNDQSAKHRIILGHIRLGMSIVARYAVQYPNKIDLMVAEICDALVMGIERIMEGAIEHHERPNITGYLVDSMNYRLMRWVTRDGVLRCSVSYYKKQLAMGKAPPVAVLPLSSEHTQIESRFSLDDIDEVVDSVTSNDKERLVIQLRLEGMSDAEIANLPQFNCKYQYIQQLRKKIGTRFLEKYSNE